MKKKTPKTLVTPAQYAKSRGLNKSTVSRQIRDGKITTKGGLLDPDQADVERARNVSVRPRLHATHATRATVVSMSDASKSTFERDIAKERAEKLRIENEKSRGALVNAAEVESATEALFRRDAEALLNWPTSVSAEMAAEVGVSESAMSAVLNRAVRQFMRERSKVPLPVEDMGK